MTDFELHPRLDQDCHFITDLDLSRLLLMNNSDYPWCILVPRVAGIREIYQLDESRQQILLVESSRLSQVMMELFGGEKMNVAALGNMVPQLHVHHIVRKSTDRAWPNPVWGFAEPVVYDNDKLSAVTTALAEAMT
ncbi:MAG: HIT domain-containing protein [Pseudomonadales bacterium]|nr:HIT domain-containing protein [Pseudomonadales bacterium]